MRQILENPYLTVATFLSHVATNNFIWEVVFLGVYNVQVYDYEGFTQFRIYNRPVEYEHERVVSDDAVILSDDVKKERSERVSLNRTKQSIYELAYNNKWDWFITFTFSDSVDRYLYDICTKRVRIWLNNLQKRKCPNLKYLIVPEQHKDGAWHIHGLLANCDGLEFVDSGRVSIGRKAYIRTDKNSDHLWIYNIPSWQYGFSTATAVQDNAKTCSYMCKYITKELCTGLKNKRRYFASKNCKKVVKENYNWATDDIENMINDFYAQGLVDYDKTQKIECAGQIVRYVTIKK